ncbi:MAG: HD domain-containing protein [Firmicutes bacterium]|nr:HD domain-containing protein [Bacillota bacterium]
MDTLTSRGEKIILEKLNSAGYEALFAGGCVRDAVMQKLKMTVPASGDIDVTTNALPEETERVFDEYQVIETGIKHGTVTVVLQEGNVEITTYRNDGSYSDSRHPDNVRFVASLEEDLARRDFTINAMACDADGNIIDPFGGQQDIKNMTIRAVGCAETRFAEDALRIMRALRFAAVLGFEIEEETSRALCAQKQLLRNISAERVFTEFRKLLSGRNAGAVIRKYVDVLGEVIPELAAMKGFEQHNPYHRYDVLEHCIRAMEAVRTTPENRDYMKMAALFHDIGKPETYSMDENGIGHFYSHPAMSEVLVSDIMKRFKADNFTARRVAVLVKRHDLIFEKDERLLKKWMNRLGADVLAEILEIKLADNMATGNMSPELEQKFCEIRIMIQGILAQQQCFSLRDLAVDGNDVIACGVAPGPEVGKLLEQMLMKVIDGELTNDRDVLVGALKKMFCNSD